MIWALCYCMTFFRTASLALAIHSDHVCRVVFRLYTISGKNDIVHETMLLCLDNRVA